MFGFVGVAIDGGARADAGGHDLLERRRDVRMSRPRIAVARRQTTMRRHPRQVTSRVS
jgi:hypothetical protein